MLNKSFSLVEVFNLRLLLITQSQHLKKLEPVKIKM